MKSIKDKILDLINSRQRHITLQHEREYLATLIDSLVQKEIKKTETTTFNNTQEHFLRVFKNDIPKEDFEDLKKVIGKWLAEKLIKQSDLDLIENAKR